MERLDFAKTVGIILLAALAVYGFGCGEDDCVEALFTLEAMGTKTIIVGMIVLFYALDKSRKMAGYESIVYRIDRCPMTTIKHATAGAPASVAGRVTSESVLRSPYSYRDCVYYHSITERYVKSGKSGSWKVTENIAEYVPFRIKDGGYELVIELANMDDDLSGFKIIGLKRLVIHGEESGKEIQLSHTPSQKNSEIDCNKILDKDYIGSDERRTEYILPPDTEVFVYGMVSKGKDGLFVHESKEEPLVVSKRNKEDYVEDFFGGRVNRAIYWSCFLISIGIVILYIGLSIFIRLPLILLLLAQFGVFWFLLIRIYNRIVLLFQRGKDSLSHIDVQLKRRASLIPAMNRLVEGYATYERRVMEDLAKVRAEILNPYNAAGGADTYEKEKGFLKDVIALIERNPDLKASDAFKDMMSILVDTEERISYSRSFYNRTVLKYNTLITTFPGIVFALIFRFQQMQYFNLEDKQVR